jgi:hypothetical protein
MAQDGEFRWGRAVTRRPSFYDWRSDFLVVNELRLSEDLMVVNLSMRVVASVYADLYELRT